VHTYVQVAANQPAVSAGDLVFIKISKFRISNLEETPIMLNAKRGGAYKKVNDVQVEEMLRRST